jgi:hypothetical protein
MKNAGHTNFIGILSEDKPVMIFFHYKEDESKTNKIKNILKDIEKDLPLLNIYDYLIDLDEANQTLANHLDVSATPLLVFFKEGSFHRYKDKLFTKPSILQFIGNKKIYQLTKDDKNVIDNPLVKGNIND